VLSTSLKSIRVVDFTQVAAGPTCSLMLADLGADVVKIEAPSGDLCRALAPHVSNESVQFMALNGNKRSIVLDLKDEQDLGAARTLCSHADVVLESFRPGVMDRLGLGSKDVLLANPKAIYCSISGFGQHGPWRDLPGVDGVLQAVTGLMSINGSPGGSPSKMQVPVVDMVTGYLASIAVLASLHERRSTGRGKHLDINMFSCAIALQQGSLASYFATREVPKPIGSAAPYAAPNEALRCADGWIMVAAYHPQRWKSFCEIIGSPELADADQFSTLTLRVQNRAALNLELERLLGAKTIDEWQRLFRAADIICGGIYNYEQVEASPQFQALNMTEWVAHPTAGALEMPRFTLGGGVGRAPARRPSPTLGQHTTEVMAEIQSLTAGQAPWAANHQKQELF
jgi:crotonobetainyl-CoA:carnitine CoA-transferase CaiB-like acyl-CoA transferase